MINPEDYGISFDKYLAKQLKDPEFKKSFEKFQQEDAASIAVIVARQKAGWSQQELADKAGVPQSTVARFERGANTSVRTLNKLVTALGGKISITF